MVRTTIPTDGPAPLTLSGSWRDIAITPDGSRVVWVSGHRIVVRSLDELESRVLNGLGAPRNIFLSPDGRWIGFFDGQTIKKVPITGGAPSLVSAVQGDAAGATWGPDGTIVFATADRTTGLQRVNADGGTPTVLTRPSFERGEREHVWPEFLPGGGAVLFTMWGSAAAADTARVGVLDLRTGEQKTLDGVGTHARYVSTGHLLYGMAGTLHAVAFDPERLRTAGTPVPVLEDVEITGIGAVNAVLAANGSLVYVPGAEGGRQNVRLFDRDGAASPLKNLAPGPYRAVRVSPDGSKMALSIGRDLWIYEFSSGLLFQVTRDPVRALHPLWSPDGLRLVFTSGRSGFPELFWRPADGTGTDARVVGRSKDLTDLIANDWARGMARAFCSRRFPRIFATCSGR